MQGRIVSDGTPQGTRVTDENGVELKPITEITWHMVVGDVARADVTMLFMKIEADAMLRLLGPNGKPVKRVIYHDGTEEEFSE